MILRLILFFVLNFGTLALGGMFTGEGVPSEWYANINKAPWTPPGWVFGAAWTSIMLCFSVYMARAWADIDNKKLLLGLYAVQLVLNIGWNPAFFYYHDVLSALFIISALAVLIGFMLFFYWPVLKFRSLLIAPYFVWLLIATSLNAYILFMN